MQKVLPSVLVHTAQSDHEGESMRRFLLDGHSQFSRIGKLIDVELMARTRVLCVGSGSGGQHLVRTLSAMGVREFILMDPDVVSPANIGTTVVTHQDIGRPKVDVAAEAIAAISPAAKIRTIQSTDTALQSGEAERLVASVDLVLHLSDDVGAAIRLNDLALDTSTDVIHAATHPGNRGFEILATLPADREFCGCYRCRAKTRCDAFEAGMTPVGRSFHSSRLPAEMRNTVTAYAAVGLLHERAGADRPIREFGAALRRNPHWVGRLAIGAFGDENGLFSDVSDDLLFGVKPYPLALPAGWVCPACNYGAQVAA